MPTLKVTTLSDLASEDILDSQDLEELITTLEAEQSEAIEDKHDASWDSTDEAELLDAIRDLRQETEDEGWEYGIVFIRDSYFEDYAQDFAENIGVIDAAALWPNNCIDWERAAEELQWDYSTATIGGVTFWYRGV